MSVENDSLNYWLSYSGNEQYIANALFAEMNSHRRLEISQKAIEESIETDLSNCANHYFRLNVYNPPVKEKQFGGPDYSKDEIRTHENFVLNPGAPVSRIINAIGVCPLKAVILSKSYLTKPACLLELCLSLCFSGASEHELPLIITCGIPANGDAFESDYPVYCFQQKQLVNKSLEQALFDTHSYVCQHFAENESWRAFNLSASFQTVLSAIIIELKDTTFIEARTICNTDVSKQKEITDVQKLAVGIYKQGYERIQNSKVLERDHTYHQALYNDWVKHPTAKMIVNTLSAFQDGFVKRRPSEQILHFTAINKSTDVRLFWTRLRLCLGANSDLFNCDYALPLLNHFLVMAVLKGIDSTGHRLRNKVAVSNEPLMVYFDNVTNSEFIKSCHCSLVLSHAKNWRPKTPDCKENKSIDDELAPGTISLVKTDISKEGYTEYGTVQAMQQLVEELVPHSSKQNCRSIDDFKTEPKLLDKLRSALLDMDEDNYIFLQFDYDSQNAKQLAYQISHKLESLISQGRQDISIPCVIMRAMPASVWSDYEDSGVNRFDFSFAGELGTLLQQAMETIQLMADGYAKS